MWESASLSIDEKGRECLQEKKTSWCKTAEYCQLLLTFVRNPPGGVGLKT
jgi:hypothetical protein